MCYRKVWGGGGWEEPFQKKATINVNFLKIFSLYYCLVLTNFHVDSLTSVLFAEKPYKTFK